MIWFKLAFREIRNNSHFSWFFIINLTLGLVGFIALDSFKISIHHHISNKSRAMLSADLDVRSRRALSPEDLAFIENHLNGYVEKARQVTFLSMLAGEKESRLVQIVAVDESYPLYGKIVLSDDKVVGHTDLKNQLIRNRNIWVQPELLNAIGNQIGSKVTIGQLDFTLSDIVTDTSTGTMFFSSIAYRIFMGLNQAEKTGLLRFGSRRNYHYFYKLPENADVEEIATRLKNKINQKYGPNSALFVNTHNNAGRRIKRFLGYLNDYLGLVSLVALFMAGVGTAYLFRSYMAGNMKEMAILMILGATKMRTYLVLMLQITLLGTVSAMLAVGLSMLFLPLLTLLLQGFLPKGFTAVFSYQSVLLAFAMGMSGSILFCLPVLNRIRNLKPLILFNEDRRSLKLRQRFHPTAILSYLPVALTFWLIAVWQSHSWIIGSTFMASLLISFVIIGFIGWFLLSSSNRYLPDFTLIIKLAFRNLYRNKTAVISSFLAIGLGALLINLIPQIHEGLQNEISKPSTYRLPSFFLFDIQPEQVEPLKTFLAQKNYIPDNVSAMIESRLTHINGVENLQSEKKTTTREQEQGRAMRRRTQNLSYRLNLYESETLIAGRPFSGVYNPESGQLPEISVDPHYAEGLKVGVGDTLTFNVQGIPVQGKIINLRKVKWQSAQPNFYVIFQPGVLEEAPSTSLATIYKVKDEDKVSLQNDLIKKFPNISSVDVSKTVDKILDITGQISWAIQVMAFSAVLVGIIVVYSIARYNSQNRMQEINLLKVLGADFNDIRKMVLLEFGMFGFTASLVGSSLSLAASWILSLIVFESIWAVAWPVTAATILSITLLTMAAAYLGTVKTLNQKPISLLQSV